MDKKESPYREQVKKFLENKDGGNLKKAVSLIRENLEGDIKLSNPEEFYKKIMRPVESPIYNWLKQIKEAKPEDLEKMCGPSQLLEFDLQTNKYRFRQIKNGVELREAIEKSEKVDELVRKTREAKLRESRKKIFKNLAEDFFANEDPPLINPIASYPVKLEYTPLLGTPFFKQMYLYDYLQAHSKAFYFKNYSGIAKNIIDNTRNFVLGKGFSLSIKDDTAQKAWDEYVERNDLNTEVRRWCDELTVFGEVFIKRIPTPQGVIHRSVDPSTIWEIVTDPENIYDVKYYHQQYPTQYQLYTAPGAPSSEYVFNQIPPEQIIHKKVNVTAYEKRGRSDLLAALLYFKYFEEHTEFKLLRVKNEAAFIWDVTIKGDDSDIAAYIANTTPFADVPIGSENVHNEAVERKPLAPVFSHGTGDDVIKWVVSYIAMSVNLPVNYLGTFESGGHSTRAGSLVATEPVFRKFEERQRIIEDLLHEIFVDVMLAAGLDPKKIDHEFNFPEFVTEDRSKKIEDLIVAKDEGSITHKRMSEIIAKELNVSTYDYEQEMKDIEDERESKLPLIPGMDSPDTVIADDPALTPDKPGAQAKDNRSFDRSKVKQDHDH